MLHGFGGQSPQLHPSAFVAASADLIGAVTVGPESSVWFAAVLRADQNEIRVGARSNVQDGVVIHADKPTDGGEPVVIGDGVTIGHQAHLHGCRIGDHCLIGSGSIVLNGADLPPHTFVAAGSLVRPGTTAEPGKLLMGRPARPFRPVTDQERDYIRQAAESYVLLAKDYRAG